MAQILVGTCSWTDPTLIKAGTFYPDWARTPEARLQFYASQFPLVEVDSSFYALPAEATARLWVERTGADFLFDIKAFRLLTHHPTPPASLPQDIRQALPPELGQKTNLYYRELSQELKTELWQRFERALLPLDTAGKLGVVLFQFPPWFFPSRENKEYILRLREFLPQYTPAIEFRAASWLTSEQQKDTFTFLRENRLPFVCVDEPQGFQSSLPPVAEATADIALVRFHGRNRETWEKKGTTATERFNYLYREEELQEWRPKIEKLATKASQMHVLFNNCYGDQAVKNGRQMSQMLEPKATGL